MKPTTDMRITQTEHQTMKVIRRLSGDRAAVAWLLRRYGKLPYYRNGRIYLQLWNDKIWWTHGNCKVGSELALDSTCSYFLTNHESLR